MGRRSAEATTLSWGGQPGSPSGAGRRAPVVAGLADRLPGFAVPCWTGTVTHRSVLLPILAASFAGMLGCGGFSSGAAPGLEPPPPPEFAKPETQGEVTGTIEVAEGFLPLLSESVDLRRLAMARAEAERAERAQASPEPNSTGNSEEQGPRDALAGIEAGPVGAGDLYAAMSVVLSGPRRRREAAVESDGSFRVSLLPLGEYRVTVKLGERELASFPALVRRQETTEVHLEVLGHDWADLDGDDSIQDLAVRVEVRAGTLAAGARRVVHPDGSIRLELPTGGVEYLLPGGVVRREDIDGGATFRYDHDLDGVADADDPDYRRSRNRPERPDEEALLMGEAFPPLIRSAKVGGASGEGAVGDLARFTASLARHFVAPAEEVRATLHGAEGEPTTFRLRDDGSLVDLSPEWPGHQPSGDEVAGDGVYTHLLPIDPSTAEALLDREVVITARDAEGRPSNSMVFFLYTGSLATRASDPGASVPVGWGGLRSVEVREVPGEGQPEVEASLEVRAGWRGLVATLMGPGSFRRVLSPDLEASVPGWTRLRAAPAPRPKNGLYYLVVGVPGGSVFYAGRVLAQGAP